MWAVLLRLPNLLQNLCIGHNLIPLLPSFWNSLYSFCWLILLSTSSVECVTENFHIHTPPIYPYPSTHSVFVWDMLLVKNSRSFCLSPSWLLGLKVSATMPGLYLCCFFNLFFIFLLESSLLKYDSAYKHEH